MKARILSAIALCCFLPIGQGLAAVAGIEIVDRSLYADGRTFEGIGTYDQLSGTVRFAVNPDDPANQTIVDLELAPREDDGRVVFSADLRILLPSDRSKINGTLFYVVNNRGDLTEVFLEHAFRRGYVVVASGWIAELLPNPEKLRLYAPVATHDGEPIVGPVYLEMSTDAPVERLDVGGLLGMGAGAYAPTEAGLESATLTRRLYPDNPREAIDRSRFRMVTSWEDYKRDRDGLPRVEVVLKGGFEPGYLYELIYEAKDPVVQGLGLAGIRDLVSFLRYDESSRNPLWDKESGLLVQHTLGFGASQSGRLLRQFLYDGFNGDERGRIVFDGLMPLVAGAGLGSFNHRFAMPSRANLQHENHLYPVDVFPFTYGEARDPFTGRTDGLLQRARKSRTVPKIMHIQTSAEYWHRSASLVHTDPEAEQDAEIPSDVRIYALCGAQHGPGSGVPQPPTQGQLPENPADFRPMLWALTAAMNDWIAEDRPPPPSRYPRVADGTLVGWRAADSNWQDIPGIRYPTVIQQPAYADYGAKFATHWVMTKLPPEVKGHYRVRVPAVGPDNNERGCLQLPSTAVAHGTYTGWNLRHARIGAARDLFLLRGSYIPFVATAQERRQAGDPRPALLERYESFDDYFRQYEEATSELIEERYLLPEDKTSVLEIAQKARARFD